MSRTLRPTQAVPSMELTISPAKRVNRCGHSTQHSRHRPTPTKSDPSALQPGSVALTSTKPSSACFRYTPTPHCRGTSRCTGSVAALVTLEELRRRVAWAAVDVELSGGSDVCEMSDELGFRARVKGTCAAALVLATLEELRRRVAWAAVDVELSGGSDVCEVSDELRFRARVRGTCVAECD
jgi:hypothetical protein